MSEKKCTSSLLRKRAAAIECTGAVEEERQGSLSSSRFERESLTVAPSSGRSESADRTHEDVGKKLTAHRRTLQPGPTPQSTPGMRLSGRSQARRFLQEGTDQQGRRRERPREIERVQPTKVAPEVLRSRNREIQVSFPPPASISPLSDSHSGCRSRHCRPRPSS